MGKLISIRLGELASARSGDKGSGANVAILARNQKVYDWLKDHFRESQVEEYFRPFGVGKVIRYEVPNLQSFNFILPGVLTGGGPRALRNDAQGKALGQALLEFRLSIDEEVFTKLAQP